jgi:hypothetical protein
MHTVEQADALQRSLEGQLISEKAARARANRFVLKNLRDGLCAGQPRFIILGEEPAWSVPLLFARPDKVFGEVGQVIIQAVQGTILGFTPAGEVYRNARQYVS